VAIAKFAIATAWHERNHRDPAQRWLRDQIAAAAAGDDGDDGGGDHGDARGTPRG
jgi:hypothetical protein